jgi:hypothetical protein
MSPRDLNERQLAKYNDIHELPNTRVLIDPQFYLPHADHERLIAHRYWPKDYDTGLFWTGPGLDSLLTDLAELNSELETDAVILPGLLANEVSREWLFVQTRISEESERRVRGRRYLTLALSSDVLRSQDEIAELIEVSEDWDCGGYYLVLEHPQGRYLVDDPNWLASALDLIASLKLRGQEVILGYCNQQMLIAACAKADAIASGTWMNVRSFPPDKFRTTYEEEIKQRATWYYCPHAFSEYKLPFLDIAFRQRVLSRMAPQPPIDDEYVKALFGSAQPSTIGLSEQAAFRHYLSALRSQAISLVGNSFDEVCDSYESHLAQAESVLGHLVAAGIRGQHRDFADLIDVNRAALEVLKTTHGPRLRRRWSQL